MTIVSDQPSGCCQYQLRPVFDNTPRSGQRISAADSSNQYLQRWMDVEEELSTQIKRSKLPKMYLVESAFKHELVRSQDMLEEVHIHYTVRVI
jgi:hypothetical protein